MILFEPIRSVFTQLEQYANTQKNAHIICVNKALGAEEGERIIHLSSNDYLSSSLLEPKEHLTQFTHVQFTGKEKITVTKLDSCNLPETFDFLLLDVQGFELEVLKGAIKTLQHIRTIYLEYSLRELYAHQPLLHDIDAFLDTLQFKRIVTGKDHWTCGNALYRKKGAL